MDSFDMTTNQRIHKCLMRLRPFQQNYLFIWCFYSILISHTDSHVREVDDITTVRGVYYTFGFKVNNLKDFRNRSNWHTINQLKDHIKFVLNFDANNDTIDKYVVESFNIYNPDPMYVFLLPDSTNRTLVFRRSNFSEISFPNTTSVQTLQKILKQSKLGQYFPHDVRAKQSLTDDSKFATRYRKCMSDNNDLNEAESLKIIEENVRTEKNFFKFMDKLNNERSDDDMEGEGSHKQNEYTSLIRDLHSKDHIGNYKLADDRRKKLHRPKNDKLSWEDFGLSGWVGHINAEHQHPKENGSPMRIELMSGATKELRLFPNKFVPILANYDPLSLLTSTTTTPIPHTSRPHKHWPNQVHQFSFVEHNRPVSSRPRPPPIILSSMHSATQHPVKLFEPAPDYVPQIEKPSYSTHRKPFKLDNTDYWDIKFNISDELRNLLNLEKIQLQNISQMISSNPKWAVTNSRSKHRDDDIFVARANNPFGHSTKWRLSIASHNDISSDESDEDGRQKRDVIDLYSMVKCSTGCDPLIFKGYGCYCGFFGSGNALDGIDRCCKMHDYCYHAANCPKFLEYFVPYLWKCYRGRPLCAIDHGEWGGPRSCASTLCECDRALSNCLRRFYCPRKRAVCTSSPLRLLQNILMDI